jgi:hypothetical protein
MRTKCRKSSSWTGTIHSYYRRSNPTDPVEATKKTRPNTEPGRGFFFLGSLPHLGGGEIPEGSPKGHLHRLFTSQEE